MLIGANSDKRDTHLRYIPFFDCGELLAAAGFPLLAAQFFALSYRLACADQLNARMNTDTARLESFYQVANNLRVLSLAHKWDESSVNKAFEVLVDTAVSDSTLYPIACDAFEAQARMAMQAEQYAAASLALDNCRPFALPGSRKHVSQLYAKSYASFRAGNREAPGELREANQALKGTTSQDPSRLFGHALFREGIDDFFRDRAACVNKFQRAMDFYGQSTWRPDSNTRFRGLLSISLGVAIHHFGTRHGHSQANADMLAYGHYKSGRLLLAGDDHVPYGLGKESLGYGYARREPLGSLRNDLYLDYAPLASPLVQNAAEEMRERRKTAVKYSWALMLKWYDAQEELREVSHGREWKAFMMMFPERMDQRILSWFPISLMQATARTFPDKAIELIKTGRSFMKSF